MDDSISPYELLGLIPNKCTIHDVRKAYREIALICHPDKGGNADDMRVLQAAYEWIMNQLVAIQKNEQNFKAFQASVRESVKVVPWSQVVEESSGLSKELFEQLYNKYSETPEDNDALTKQFVYQYVCQRIIYEMLSLDDIEKEIREYLVKARDQKWSYASIQEGYGSCMSTCDDTRQSFGKAEMIVYEQPQEIPQRYGGEAIELPLQLDDYTQDALCDYKNAYKSLHEPSQLQNDSNINFDFDDAYKMIQLQRRMDDMRLDENERTKMTSVMLRFKNVNSQANISTA